MTKDEILRYLQLGSTRSVCVQRTLMERYPGWMRAVQICKPSLVLVQFGPPPWGAVEFSCEGEFESLDVALINLENFLGKPVETWENYTKTGFYPETHEDPVEGETALLSDLRSDSLKLPGGARFAYSGSWLERNEYFQPRVMRHTLPDGRIEFAIHDVYFNTFGRIEGYTQHARSDRAPSVEELKDLIRSQLEEAKVGVRCGDLGYTHTADDHLNHWLQHVNDPVLEYSQDG